MPKKTKIFSNIISFSSWTLLQHLWNLILIPLSQIPQPPSLNYEFSISNYPNLFVLLFIIFWKTLFSSKQWSSISWISLHTDPPPLSDLFTLELRVSTMILQVNYHPLKKIYWTHSLFLRLFRANICVVWVSTCVDLKLWGMSEISGSLLSRSKPFSFLLPC